MLGPGFHDVPAGHVAAVVTHLEMRARAEARDEVAGNWTLRRVNAPDVDWYCDLYNRVGGQNWLWFSRMEMAAEELAAIIGNAKVHVYALSTQGRDEGLLELDFRVENECELAFFGLTSAVQGSGAGRWLMNRAIAKAWEADITRFHVHTCTLDHHAALNFYIRSGFTPIHRQIEIAPDPRVTGSLPPDAGPHVPILAEPFSFKENG